MVNPNISAEMIKWRSNVNKLPDDRRYDTYLGACAQFDTSQNKTKINKRSDKYLLHPSIKPFLCTETCIFGSTYRKLSAAGRL